MTFIKPADLQRHGGLLLLQADEEDDPAIRRAERGPATANASAPVAVRVAIDTWIARPDLPPGNHTFVAAGGRVPPELVGYGYALDPVGLPSAEQLGLPIVTV